MNVGKLRPVRGTRDLSPEECYKFWYIRDIAHSMGERYGFVPVETPIFEFQDVFLKTLGDSSDIIGKEMYSFPDRGGDVLVLRPELTAAVARMLICERLALPARLFTFGPVFRYERPQKCRQRQFHQINYEHFGAGCTADAELMALAYDILGALNLRNKVHLEINSLGSQDSILKYKSSLLQYFSEHEHALSGDSRRRVHTNPLRILDSKDRGDMAILCNAPVVADFYDDESKMAFDGVVRQLDNLGIPHTVNPRLVRGLDYYCGVVFEFKTTCLGAQDAVIAGGRYDKLVASMGGDNVPAVGFAGGMERLASLVDYSHGTGFSVAFLPLGEGAVECAMRSAYELRSRGIRVLCDGAVEKLKIGLKHADRSGVDLALILGDEEIAKGEVLCRHMATGAQETVSICKLGDYVLGIERSAQGSNRAALRRAGE
ncbi:histidyl-tRNA synthetase [Anaplasma centrale str. Israel]|uniref:Histidine--tRNA ligase n=1 Tax=Anaplasma centrale (strain Israel) TaxID=574556 RepID=D1ASZ8_ANACI|nr:histidine--tRNA ligase [Anaplasma centrale]ACZ49601.1 histidyl-tRNA synthetase [Anaplasma centrale str. Israel]